MKENEVKPEDRLNDKAKLAIRDYMLKLVTVPGIVLTIAGFLLGFLVNEIARKEALQEAYKEAYQDTMDKISGTIVKVTTQTTAALSYTEQQGEELQGVLIDTENMRKETEVNLIKTQARLDEVLAASTGVRNQEKELSVLIEKVKKKGEQLEEQFGLIDDSRILDPEKLVHKVAESLAGRDAFKTTLYEEFKLSTVKEVEQKVVGPAVEEVKEAEERFEKKVEAVEKVQIEIRQDLEDKIFKLDQSLTTVKRIADTANQKTCYITGHGFEHPWPECPFGGSYSGGVAMDVNIAGIGEENTWTASKGYLWLCCK